MSRDNESNILYISGGRGGDGGPGGDTGGNGGRGGGPILNYHVNEGGILTNHNNIMMQGHELIGALLSGQPVDELLKFKDGIFTELASASQRAIEDIKSFVRYQVQEIGNWASEEEHIQRVTEQILQLSNGMINMVARLITELRNSCLKDDWERMLSNHSMDQDNAHDSLFGC
ncbi:hypothetical protein DFH06DRAFT_173693 [Mycena polygramma]|nr:hypothetical protein DFH06DRAFT_173693 [Mycena polygramma]